MHEKNPAELKIDDHQHVQLGRVVEDECDVVRDKGGGCQLALSTYHLQAYAFGLSFH